MGSASSFRSVSECYARAIAMETEAVRRLREFAELASDHGDEAGERLLRELAGGAERHVAALERHAAQLAMPQLESWRYSWIDDAPPEKVAHELVHHLLTVRDALGIALGACRRALAFFREVEAKVPDDGLRRLAGEIALEQAQHIARIEDAIPHVPRPFRYGEDYEAFAMR